MKGLSGNIHATKPLTIADITMSGWDRPACRLLAPEMQLPSLAIKGPRLSYS